MVCEAAAARPGRDKAKARNIRIGVEFVIPLRLVY